MVTLNSLGLDLARSVVYGFCAILAPVGYNRCRDPDNQPFGLSLLPGYAQGRCVADTGEICLPGEGDRSPDQVEALRERYTMLKKGNKGRILSCGILELCTQSSLCCAFVTGRKIIWQCT